LRDTLLWLEDKWLLSYLCRSSGSPLRSSNCFQYQWCKKIQCGDTLQYFILARA
jgi:hypothetical protein